MVNDGGLPDVGIVLHWLWTGASGETAADTFTHSTRQQRWDAPLG